MNLDPIPLLVNWGTPLSLPPAFIFFSSAFLVLLLRSNQFANIRKFILIVTPAIGLWNLTSLPMGISWEINLLQFELIQLKVDRLSFSFWITFSYWSIFRNNLCT